MIQINSEFEIDKIWLKELLNELGEIYSQIKKKKNPENSDESVIDKISRVLLTENPKDSAMNPAKLKEAKLAQENAMKKLENRLFQLFGSSSEPYWLNLILIENTKDYQVNKFNTLSLIVARVFQKWTTIKKIKPILLEEIKVFAFLISTKHHLLITSFIAEAYQLAESNTILLPYLKHRIEKMDNKEKALLIGYLKLQEKFTIEEVIFLPGHFYLIENFLFF